MRLHHIGYLVKSLDRSIAAFRALDYEPVLLCEASESAEYMYDEYRQCDICFLRQPAAAQTEPTAYVELIAPKSEASPIWGLMRTYKNSPYHLCFESDDLEADIQHLRGAGWMIFQPEAPAPAIHDLSVVFLVHRSAGIIELININANKVV